VTKFLLERKFTLLFGHRQAGKSTTCYMILQWFQDHPEKIRDAGFDPQKLKIRMVTFDATINTEEPSMFWESVCKKFQTTDQKLFSFNTAEKCTSSTFQNFFSKRNSLSQKPIIILIDEASRLSANNSCTTQFIDSLRTLKGDRDNFCLVSIVLIGTASIRDFLVSYSQQRPTAMSKISSFSAEAYLTCNRFTKAEVEDLFKQFATENNVDFKSSDIAKDIFDLTLGHKGLVGTCGSYIQNIQHIGNDHIQTLDDWKKHTPIQLLKNISVMATYQSIMRTLDTLSPSHRSILIKVLRFGMCQIDLVS
jgi:hypothetical protein